MPKSCDLCDDAGFYEARMPVGSKGYFRPCPRCQAKPDGVTTAGAFTYADSMYWCSARDGDDTIWGRGATPQDAIEDLAKSIREAEAFKNDDPLPWWSAVNNTDEHLSQVLCKTCLGKFRAGKLGETCCVNGCVNCEAEALSEECDYHQKCAVPVPTDKAAVEKMARYAFEKHHADGRWDRLLGPCQDWYRMVAKHMLEALQPEDGR